jgi:S-DNA-T family DNA segregation ATPase FtsK/SpoIIIE
MEEEVQQQTRIRIVRKDEPEPEVENVLQEDEGKKVDLQKVGEIPDSKIDREGESSLPNQWEENIDYKKPSFDLLEPNPEEDFVVAEEELKRNAELLKEKLKLFDIEIQDISVTPGPVVTLYEIVPAPGVKISRIVGLENDIALALAARGIRIIAPIPGKSAIGVEIPNAEALLVNARSVLTKVTESKYELPVALGKTISGDVYLTDLSKMPHLLIAGSTGSGKSVGINMIISSLLYTKEPMEVKLAMIDPKKIELSFYKKLRRHFLTVSPDLDEEIITSPQNAVLLLKSVEFEMEKRYDKLAKAGVRNIVDYNEKVSVPARRPKDTEEMKHHHMPYIIVIVDELADLMITVGKEVEEPITRLAQLARAVGIHLVLATQRPSVNVITGVIKANFSSRIAYQVATKIDSRTILDMNGAEQLLGNGDMLFLPTGSPKPIRIQNAFISSDEVEKITNYIYSQQAFSKPYYLPSIYEKKKQSSSGFLADLDPMFEDAARVIVRHQQGSVSLLQRRLKLGYSRAARIVDQLEEAGIVGPNDGSKARTVLVENEEQLETVLRNL